MQSEFEKAGYLVFFDAIDPKTIETLRVEVERLRIEHSFTCGLRRLTQLSMVIDNFVTSIPIRKSLEAVGMHHGFLVRSILFDKTPESNWKVAWHQDTKIPIKERIPTEGFAAWSLKDGVHHAQPPAEILGGMRTLRIHLDKTPKENGALRVVPSSHSSGFLKQNEIARLIESETSCECSAGDVLAMSPLLLHASSPAARATHRRVIHLEFADSRLPLPLEWGLA